MVASRYKLALSGALSWAWPRRVTGAADWRFSAAAWQPRAVYSSENTSDLPACCDWWSRFWPGFRRPVVTQPVPDYPRLLLGSGFGCLDTEGGLRAVRRWRRLTGERPSRMVALARPFWLPPQALKALITCASISFHFFRDCPIFCHTIICVASPRAVMCD